MAEFTPITTQEQLDTVIAARLKRDRETQKKDFDSQILERDTKLKEYEKQIGELGKQLEASGKKDETIKELQGKVKSYETASMRTRIANEIGLPYELASRLTGEDEETVRKDAESLKALFGHNRSVAPMATGEPSEKTGRKPNTMEDGLREAVKQFRRE